MIIDYDHNPNITEERRLQSLKESVQMALNDVESKESASAKGIAALEEKLKAAYTPERIFPAFHQCTNGSYTRCYKLGRIVVLSFNINVTTATNTYDYLTGLPKAYGGGCACCANTASGSSRYFVTTDGTLRSDGAPLTGWQNGSVAYICE